ncbi:uncharacterized protein EKO05_0002477 [Ascochyta rabiei]|uniref:uncharacterized protein n=1 Tax=Didymella rabiei TaxID=5454 RepID=UPI001900736B|nr:uncharacterized protein EKO05_0002477 [Ascochyta rabiei]UPX11893.1 hypothetical protein EKO05_0002477 [Ascochyta rabiei]
MAAQTPSTKSELDPASTSAWHSSDVAQQYKFAENATRPFAALMVSKTHLAHSVTSKPARIFDLACGTGAVEAEMYSAIEQHKWDAVEVLAGDISQPMVDYLARRGEREGWRGLTTRVVDGAKLDVSLQEEAFTHVFVGFGIFLLPLDTLRKLAGLLHPGGALAVTTWATVPWYQLLEKTYARIENGPELPSPMQLWGVMTNGRPWYESSFVEQQLQEAGLRGVEMVQRRLKIDCGTPEVFMTTMGFVVGMLSKMWREDLREKWVKEVVETMKAAAVEEAGGMDKPVFMDCEGIVGVRWKGE